MRNHEDQVKKEASRIHKCLMHVHINKVPQDGQNPDGTPTKKRKKKKKNQLYNSPTMVPLSSHSSGHEGRSGVGIGKKMSSDSSSDDDLIIMGESKKGENDMGLGGMPRSLVESLNHYERTLAASMIGGQVRGGGSGGKKLQDSNISSSNQFGNVQGGVMGATNGSGGGLRGNRFEPGRPGGLGLQGLMGLPGMDPALMSSQHPEMIERAAAAAAAAVSSQLHGLNHVPINTSSAGGVGGNLAQNQAPHNQMQAKSSGNNTDSTSTISTRAPTSTPPVHPLDMVGMGGGQYGGQNPYLSASHLMDAHLRSQLTPMSLPGSIVKLDLVARQYTLQHTQVALEKIP
nr:hypothetical protein BaRGS_005341 [Batillaria attramentaria]